MTDHDPTAARREKLAALHQLLDEQVTALRAGKDWKACLDVAARLHSYSFNNVLLIAAARPDATFVGGYQMWRSLGRQVDKGERGIQILAPIRRQVPRPDDGDAVPDSSQDREPSTAPARRSRATGWPTSGTLPRPVGNPCPNPPGRSC